jgi:hypothetical protein
MNSKESNPYPETVREVFAWYGAAMHAAQFFEGDLISLYMTARAWRNEGATLPQLRTWEEAVSRDTLGRLLKRIAEIKPISAEVQQLWDQALSVRNQLAHNFFWSHFEQLSDSQAHDGLVSRLREVAHVFNNAAQAAREAVEQLVPLLGIDAVDWKAAQENEMKRLRKDGA